MKELIVGCFQMEVVPGDVEGNLNKVERILPQLRSAGCQLVVFPEMWAGGFIYSALQEMAERTPNVLEKLREWAVQYRMVLVGSLPEAEGDKVFNTSYVLDAGGEVAGKYRKMHLFSLTGEPDYFARGQVPLVCDTTAGRLGIAICYDLRFPELSPPAGAGWCRNHLPFGALAGHQDRPLVIAATQPRHRKPALRHGLQRLWCRRRHPIRRSFRDHLADREGAWGSRRPGGGHHRHA